MQPDGVTKPLSATQAKAGIMVETATFDLTSRNDDEEGKEHNTGTCPNLNPTEKTRIDGGCSWIVCAAGFLIQCIVAAQGNLSGIIFTALLDEYNSNRSQTGKKSFSF